MKRFPHIQIGFVAMALLCCIPSVAVIDCATLLRATVSGIVLDLETGKEYEFGGLNKDQQLAILIGIQQQGLPLKFEENHYSPPTTAQGTIKTITGQGQPLATASPKNILIWIQGGAGYYLSAIRKFELIPDSQGPYSLMVETGLVGSLLPTPFLDVATAKMYPDIATITRPASTPAPGPAPIYHNKAAIIPQPASAHAPYNTNVFIGSPGTGKTAFVNSILGNHSGQDFDDLKSSTPVEEPADPNEHWHSKDPIAAPTDIDELSAFMAADAPKLRPLIDDLIASGKKSVLYALYKDHTIRGKRLAAYVDSIKKGASAAEVAAAYEAGITAEQLITVLQVPAVRYPYPKNGTADDISEFMRYPQVAPDPIIDAILEAGRRDVLERLYNEMELQGPALKPYFEANGGTAASVIQAVDKTPRPKRKIRDEALSEYSNRVRCHRTDALMFQLCCDQLQNFAANRRELPNPGSLIRC